MKQSERLSVPKRFLVTEKDHDDLTKCCQITGLSPSEIIRTALKNEMEKIFYIKDKADIAGVDFNWEGYKKR